ncbi:MAG: sorbosone dehydrogenase family protein [Myxococcales bacterium]|nr:MAG: sorbosone dehydrogenase family protein [Myxococcales bacterium]
MTVSKTKRWMNVRYTLLAAAAVASLAGACSDDDDDDGPGTGARSGSSGSAGKAGSGQAGESDTGGQGGTSTAGTSGGGTGGSLSLGGTGEEPTEGGAGGETFAGAGAGGGSGGSDDGIDRDAFRPEELPFDQAAFEALSLPEGFSINVYRTGLGQARMLGVHGPHVYVTQPMQGNVVRLIDEDGDGVAEDQAVVASGLPMVHGITFHEDDVYLANVHNVYRATVAADGSFDGLTSIIADLPDGGQHALRTLGVGPDSLLYISVGSSCDACQEPNPEHATLLRSTLAGQPAGVREIFASGLRNTIGFGWHPTTGALWGMDQGSDWRGDDLPPEELNAIEAGEKYGWPYCYADRQVDPIIQGPPGSTKAEYCATTTPPVLLNQAHQSPIGFAFYTGDTFPDRYQEGAFIAFRGSWNRKPATGYRVAFVPFVEGEPQDIEDFVSGFLNEAGTATFGRPAGIAVAPDGALLFTDDTNGIVYRVQAE